MVLSIDVFKKQAHILKSFLNKKSPDISLSSCLQAIAIINGYKDWNTMNAIIIKNNSENDMSSDTAERLENLEIAYNDLVKKLDKIQTKIDHQEPYILQQQGIDPWNFPD